MEDAGDVAVSSLHALSDGGEGDCDRIHFHLLHSAPPRAAVQHVVAPKYAYIRAYAYLQCTLDICVDHGGITVANKISTRMEYHLRRHPKPDKIIPTTSCTLSVMNSDIITMHSIVILQLTCSYPKGQWESIPNARAVVKYLQRDAPP